MLLAPVSTLFETRRHSALAAEPRAAAPPALVSPRAPRAARRTMSGMAVDVVSEAVIERSCAEVAEYAANPSNAPDWYVNIQSVEWQTPPPLGVGSRLAFVA